jgi:hypothetical protein
VTLLRRNKAAQVGALRELGFDVADEMRAAEFGKYMKWAVGLLDVTIAANRISDGSKWFFTTSDWDNLTNAHKEEFLVRGVRVRANCRSFVIAPEEQGTTWGTTTNVAALTDYGDSSTGLYAAGTPRADTEAIVAQIGEANAGAATYCLNYRAFGAADGLEDTTAWALPTVEYLMLMYRYMEEINRVWQVLSTSFALTRSTYWTCVERDGSNVWTIAAGDGGVLYWTGKTATANARPIAVE